MSIYVENKLQKLEDALIEQMLTATNLVKIKGVHGVTKVTMVTGVTVEMDKSAEFDD